MAKQRIMESYLSAKRLKSGDVRFQWRPGPRGRRAGLTAIALHDATGRPSGLDEANAQARWLNAIMKLTLEGDSAAARRLADQWHDNCDNAGFSDRFNGLTPCHPVTDKLKVTNARPAAARDFSTLAQLYRQSSFFASLAHSTRLGYQSHLRALEAAFGAEPVAHLRRARLRLWYEDGLRVHGAHVANARARVLSAVLSYAGELEWIDSGVHPMARFRMMPVKGRVRFVSDAEIACLIEAADRMNRPSIGDGVLYARHLGQRRADVLRLQESQRAGPTITMRQEKTSKVMRLEIVEPAVIERMEMAADRNRRLHGDLAARLIEAGKRRPRLAFLDGLTGPTLIVSERTGLPYHPCTFSHNFAPIRAAAARRLASCDTMRFQDLRDTLVIDLVRKGLSLFQVCAITGHAVNSAQMICTAYVELHDDAVVKSATDKIRAAA